MYIRNKVKIIKATNVRYSSNLSLENSHVTGASLIEVGVKHYSNILNYLDLYQQVSLASSTINLTILSFS